MRELHAVQGVLKQVLQNELTSITNVQVAIGEISDLNTDTLNTHWHELTKNTPAEHAELRIRLIRAEVQCMACFEKYHPESGEIHCPYCGSYGAKILAGEECYLESVETTNE